MPHYTAVATTLGSLKHNTDHITNYHDITTTLLPVTVFTSAKALQKYSQQPWSSAGRYKTLASWWLLYFLPGPAERGKKSETKRVD